MTLFTAILTAVVASISAIVGLIVGAMIAAASDADRQAAQVRHIEHLEDELEQARDNAAQINDALDRYDTTRSNTTRHPYDNDETDQ